MGKQEFVDLVIDALTRECMPKMILLQRSVSTAGLWPQRRQESWMMRTAKAWMPHPGFPLSLVNEGLGVLQLKLRCDHGGIARAELERYGRATVAEDSGAQVLR